ncbi:hypothetical protein D3C78_1082380 [compost metagenome]
MDVGSHVFLGAPDEVRGNAFWATISLHAHGEVMRLAIDQCIEQNRFELLQHQRLVERMLSLGRGVHQHLQEPEEVVTPRVAQVQFRVKLQRPVQRVPKVLGTVMPYFTFIDAQCQLRGIGLPAHHHRQAR